MTGTGDRMRLAARVYKPEERDRARAIFARFDADVHPYDGLVTGWGDTDVARQLMEDGFFIDASSADKTDPVPTLPEMDLPEGLRTMGVPDALSVLAATAISDTPLIHRGYFVRVFRGIGATLLSRIAALLARPQMDPTRKMYEVRLTGPMRPEWGRKLEAAGESPASYAPPFRYRMLLTTEQLARVRELDFVHTAARYSLGETLGRALVAELQRRGDPRNGSNEHVGIDLTVHYVSQAAAIRRILSKTPDFAVIDARGPWIHFQALLNDPALIALADLEEVKTLEIHRPASFSVDVGRGQIGVTLINAQGNPIPWDGSGEVVGIVDSGVDRNHPDLTAAIKRYAPVAGATPTDSVGHGTHVAGIVAGSGTKSGGKIRGVAPGATLTIVGIVDANQNPIFPSDLTPYLRSAVAEGAKIVNLSVGRPNSNGVYDDWAQSLDTFAYSNPDVLIVVAAGNDGTASSGYPDYQTVNSPGTANNVITVGACGSVRSGIAINWGSYNAGRFPSPPISVTLMAGAPSSPAALSSRSPTQNSTLKPDVLAPGTFILSTKAASCRMKSVAPLPDGEEDYMFLHGSSLAAPFVSGSAAIIRQYLRSEIHIVNPSAALIKAILCASAQRGLQVLNPGMPMLGGYPDFDQGFGTIQLESVLPHKDGDKTRLAFADVPNRSEEALASRQRDDNPTTRSSRSYSFRVGPNAGPLRVILTWTDTPGPGVKNVLLLDVKGPSTALVGNHEYNYTRSGLFNALKLAGIPYDTRSNVQTVNIPAPASGTYYANVLAYNTHQVDGKQGYAICICGTLESDLQPV